MEAIRGLTDPSERAGRARYVYQHVRAGKLHFWTQCQCGVNFQEDTDNVEWVWPRATFVRVDDWIPVRAVVGMEGCVARRRREGERWGHRSQSTSGRRVSRGVVRDHEPRPRWLPSTPSSPIAHTGAFFMIRPPGGDPRAGGGPQGIVGRAVGAVEGSAQW